MSKRPGSADAAALTTAAITAKSRAAPSVFILQNLVHGIDSRLERSLPALSNDPGLMMTDQQVRLLTHSLTSLPLFYRFICGQHSRSRTIFAARVAPPTPAVPLPSLRPLHWSRPTDRATDRASFRRRRRRRRRPLLPRRSRPLLDNDRRNRGDGAARGGAAVAVTRSWYR